MAELKWKITKITGCDNQITLKTEGGEELEPNVEYSWPTIQASIDAVTETCDKGITVYFSASTNDTATLNVIRSCGEEPPSPVDCVKPDAVPELDGYINVFASNINATDTPCTYTYLKSGYEYMVANKKTDKITVLWMLANMLSELTPNTNDASTYFALAAHAEGAKNIDDLSNTDVSKVSGIIGDHNRRLNGAISYALYKHENYDNSVTMATKARVELNSSLRYEEFSGISYSEVVHAIQITTGKSCNNDAHTVVDNNIRILPLSKPSYERNSYDYIETDTLCSVYGNVESTKNVNGETDYQPLKDKNSCTKYLANILNVEYNDCSGLIERVSKFTKIESNKLKATYWRLRPNLVLSTIRSCADNNTFDDDGVYGKYLANTDYENREHYGCDAKPLKDDLNEYAILGGGSEEDKCSTTCWGIGPKQSFPSGHSVHAFLQLLALIEKYGDADGKRQKRIKEYCDNRAIVRAHWKTDILAGKLISSIHIGFLNGFKTFNDLIKGDTPGPTPPTTDNFFCSINGYYNCNPTCGYNDCDRERCKQEQNPGLIIWQKLNAEWENVTFEITNTNVVGSISDELKESIKNNIGIGGAGIKNGTLYKTGTRVSPDNVNYNVCESFLHYPLVNSNEHVSMTASIKFTGSRGGNVITMEYTANNTCE